MLYPPGMEMQLLGSMDSYIVGIELSNLPHLDLLASLLNENRNASASLFNFELRNIQG